MSLRRLFILSLLLLAAGCAPLLPSYETPVVTVSSFRVLPGSGIVPSFEIGLHVANPNRVPLKLAGLSYHVELEGFRVLNGVAGQLPVIEAYGEGTILLNAQPDLISTMSLFSELMSRPREDYRYRLEALLDVGGLLPKIRVQKDGSLALRGGKSN